MRGVFKAKFHAYSPAYWNSDNRDKLERGDKIVLPASALEKLSRMNVQFPIMFEISHLSDILPKKSHCGVIEFSAPEGSVYLPLWMIDNLGLDATGDSLVELTTVNLPKGKFVQFQAHETDFAMLQNPRIVLEKALRGYSCLTVGDTIEIEFNKRIYKLDVTQVKPNAPRGNAPPGISIIETDIEVDFKEPRDYKEWQKKQKAKELDLPPGSHFDHINGNFERVYSDNSKPKNLNNKNNPNKNKYSNSNSDNSNSNNSGNYEAKMAELNDDGLFDDNYDGFKINNWTSHKGNAKKDYFNDLKMSGSQGQKVKEKRKNKRSNGRGERLGMGSSNTSNMNKYGGTTYGKSGRGAPLGVNNNSPIVTSVSAPKTKKKEEIVGNMRYIYQVDQFGNSTLIRRLPLRKLPGAV